MCNSQSAEVYHIENYKQLSLHEFSSDSFRYKRVLLFLSGCFKEFIDVEVSIKS